MRSDKQNVLSVEVARKTFDKYRSEREKRGPLPSYLWEMAARIADLYSVQTASIELKLDYNKVKREMKKLQGKTTTSKFIEFQLTTEAQYKAPDILFEIEARGNGVLRVFNSPQMMSRISDLLNKFCGNAL